MAGISEMDEILNSTVEEDDPIAALLGNTLMGTYSQTMDAKGRMSFPVKLREIMGERFVITYGIDGCVFAYSAENFRKKAAQLQKLPLIKAKDMQRKFIGHAAVVEPDKQGRILVPQELRKSAGLEKEIVVVGLSDRCEIWSRERWEKLNESVDDNDLMSALEGLDF